MARSAHPALILGVVLGYMVESNYRRSLLISGGDHSIFVTDVLSAVLLGVAAVIVILSVRSELRRSRSGAVAS